VDPSAVADLLNVIKAITADLSALNASEEPRIIENIKTYNDDSLFVAFKFLRCLKVLPRAPLAYRSRPSGHSLFRGVCPNGSTTASLST
jgi:hypothetical protein